MKKEFTLSNLEELAKYILDKMHAGTLTSYDSSKIVTEFLKGKAKTDDSIMWIDDWLNLWPNIKNGGGKNLRSSKSECIKRMNSFVKSTGFDQKVIFKATKKYLLSKEKDDYQFARAAMYFIDKKGEGSELLTECEKLINNEYNTGRLEAVTEPKTKDDYYDNEYGGYQGFFY